MALFRRKTSRKRKAPARRKTKKRPAGTGPNRLLIGAVAALAVVAVGVGLLNWARTRTGQATLLALGADKNYPEVQAAVDELLVAALPGFPGGPATDAADHDWPEPDFGPGALVRCRVVAVPAGEAWWEVQTRVAAVLAPLGARVLWGERLFPARPRNDQKRPHEQKDALRLDVGVPGRPTHTLVLVREGARPRLQWGAGAGEARWRAFAGEPGPLVALVIDDWGNHKQPATRAILGVPAPLTLAVLPDLPYSRYFSLEATDLVLPPGRDRAPANDPAARGRRLRLEAGCPVEVALGPRREDWPARRREVILHLPMQPVSYPDTDPGPDAVLVGMGRDEIAGRLDAALATLGGVTGVNNHMGSAATADQPTMRLLMDELEDRDLVFLDSLTSPRSVAYAEAVRAGVPAARNRIFLDPDNAGEGQIRTNLLRLVEAARASGAAIGIGHPYPATAAVLAREVPRLVAEGVRFVTVSELLALQAATAEGEN